MWMGLRKLCYQQEFYCNEDIRYYGVISEDSILLTKQPCVRSVSTKTKIICFSKVSIGQKISHNKLIITHNVNMCYVWWKINPNNDIMNVQDGVIKWKYFPRYWPFVRRIHRSPANSPNKGQWRGALMFSLICALNKWLSEQSWNWRFETPSRSLSRHCNVVANDWQASWWRHQMAIFSALPSLCAGNSSVTGEFSSQRPVTLSFDVLFDLHLNKRLSEQSGG